MADIIRNLQTLQFESFLAAEDQYLCNLRIQSHALSVNACAHVTYIASLLRDARVIALKMNSLSATSDAVFHVGIIGCGRIGRHLANCLLSFGEFPVSHLKISTRRPELLEDLKAQGVSCIFDNATVARSVSLLFICCLPSQLPNVAADIKSCIQPQTIVFSLVSATPAARLRQLLGTTNVIRTDTTVMAPPGDWKWDISVGMAASLGVKTTLEKTCPLSDSKQGCPVAASDQFAALLVLSVVNSLAVTSLTSTQKLNIVNGLVLGHTRQNQLKDVLRLEDFQLEPNNKKSPLITGGMYDLSALTQTRILLCEKLTQPSVRDAFGVRYCDVFQQYLDWLIKAGLGVTRKHLDLVV